MTITTVTWIAVAAVVTTTAVRSLRARPARVPRRTDEDHDWHPRVTSGCGR
jgi:hypothetical protein